MMATEVLSGAISVTIAEPSRLAIEVDGFTGQALRRARLAQDRLGEYREYRDDRGQRDAHRALFGPRATSASRV